MPSGWIGAKSSLCLPTAITHTLSIHSLAESVIGDVTNRVQILGRQTRDAIILADRKKRDGSSVAWKINKDFESCVTTLGQKVFNAKVSEEANMLECNFFSCLISLSQCLILLFLAFNV